MKYVTAAAAAKSLQLCPTLCNAIDGSPLGSSVSGILQARTLEWVAISLDLTIVMFAVVLMKFTSWSGWVAAKLFP